MCIRDSLFTLQAFSNGFSLGFGENMKALWSQYGLLALVLGVLSPVFIYDSIKMSNRFVGPMVSFRRSLKQLADGGDPGKAQFRENDYWKEMAGDFNTIANEMRDLRSAASQSKEADKSEPVEA